ncbi:AMP-binding protein [Aeromicrobium endophyticum]|uniref:AMP-dependent synthetase n=1 Tax=Aeromicrobium endophyticum TaxID=2292704 RepID=A0A371NYS8_9ACTN|nr:AMP-binding protein [Aeromicrobium endophyticum]REK68845.1 AMP-dependent synthetase [Aeromicrobium endophyticum]
MEFPLTIKDFLDRAVNVYPERVAVVDEADQPAPSMGSLTYRDVDRLARSQAVALDDMGVPVGGRVAVLSQNSARLLISFFGVSSWGRVLVPVNFRLARPEVDYILQQSGAEVLLVDPELVHLVDPDLPVRTIVFGDTDDLLWNRTGEPRHWPGDESAPATINYTSGTTSKPKGVVLTHRNLWLNATTFGWHVGLNDDDVYLHTLPMFHANGWGMPYATSAMGVEQVVLRKVDGAEILRRVQRHGVTLLCAAPAVLTAVLEAARDWEGEVPGRARLRAVVAGAPPPTRTIERIRDELGWEFIQIYGLTETSPLLTVNRMRAEWRDEPRERQARLLGRQGAPALGVRLATDPSGEVLAQANQCMAGYWEMDQQTADAQVGGWFHTGDGGVLEDGYLTIVDRKKDVIVSGGENVSSIEVEDVLLSHPSVREAAVIGIPDEKWGELVTALLVTDEHVDESELMQHCRERLAGYKCPKRIEFRKNLERTATGKLQKFKLRQPYWRDRTVQVN